MLRILYDDFDQKVKNIHDEMDLHHSYKKSRVVNKVSRTHLKRILNNYKIITTKKYHNQSQKVT